MRYLLLMFLFSVSAQATPAQVLLLRHGEKPEDGRSLNAKGWKRAKALPSLFAHDGFRDNGDPAAIYAMKPSSADESLRPEETVQFLAEELHLPVHSEYGIDDYKAMVKEIMANPRYEGKLVVICWEHKVLEDIAEKFGVEHKLHYPDDAFDRAWLLTFKKHHVKFEDLPEELLPGDDEK